jgi:hypothetical protein
MGFESLRVELLGGPVDHPTADAAVRRLPGAAADPDAIRTPGSSYYLIRDGRHVFEVEVDDRPAVSCRFTLCHPPSADSAFLGLVRDLMTRLGMAARVCDEVPSEDAGPFPAERFAAFAAAATRAIAARRAEWVRQFGPAAFAATTPEVYERVILPRCEPVQG